MANSIAYGTITISDLSDGAQIWTTTVAPTTPNYTFTKTDLNTDGSVDIKVGDLIFYDIYRYTVTSVGSTTVLGSYRTTMRGNGILRVTNAPSVYTITTSTGYEPSYRMALGDVLSQSGATAVLVGDTIEYDTYHYPVGYVTANYVYMGDRIDLTGPTGATGATGATGETGQSSYTFIRYSANADGSNMTTTPQSDTGYIGVYTVTASSEPSVPAYTAFTWSKYIGEDGNGIYSKTDYYMLADTMDSSELSTAKAHFPHDVGPLSMVNFTTDFGNVSFGKLLVNVEPTITGSGDPTPSNLHTIIGKTSSNFYISSTNSAESPTVSLSWSDAAGTIYKGTWDVINGTLTNDYRILDMGSLTGWQYYTKSGGTTLQNTFRWHTTASSTIKKYGVENVFSSGYKTTSSEIASMENYTIRGSASSEYIYVKNQDYTDVSAFTAAMSGVYMLYEYENPPVYEVTPEDIFQLTGTNYVWSGSGNNVTLTYYDEVTPTWGTDPLEPNAHSKYLWWKYGTIYTDDISTEVMSDPAIIGVYNQDWYEDTQKALNTAEKAQNKADEGYDKAVAASSAASENSGRLDSVERKTETLERNVNSTQTNISSLLTIVGSSDNEGLRKFQKDASDTLEYLQKTLGDFTAWMEFKSRQDNPDDKTGLIIGKIANTGEYVVQIEGDAISFYENLDAARTSDSTKRVAFFQNHYLYVDNAKIGGNMEIDSFRFIPQANGNLSFVYIGGIE